MLPISTSLVSCFILRRNNPDTPLLLLQRSTSSTIAPLSWQILYGHIESEETVEQTLVREIREEIGLTPTELYTLNETFTFYEQHSRNILIVPVFVAVVDETAIILDRQEHAAYRWVNKDEATNLLTWQSQKPMLDVIWDLFITNTPDNLYRLTLA